MARERCGSCGACGARRARGTYGITLLVCVAVLLLGAPAAGAATLSHGAHAPRVTASEPGRPSPAPPAGPPAGRGAVADDPVLPAPSSGEPLLPVLTLGTGMTLLGLGLAFFAIRLRRS